MVNLKLFRCVLPFGDCLCKNIVGECCISYCINVYRYHHLPPGRVDAQLNRQEEQKNTQRVLSFSIESFACDLLIIWTSKAKAEETEKMR